MLRKNFVTIDLNAIRHNYLTLRKAIPQAVSVMPVVKADAYGHGMLPVAKALLPLGAKQFAVALPEEGIALREGGVLGEILVLGAAMPAAAQAAIQHRLTQTVFTPEMVALLNLEAARQQSKALVHLKLDTGMGRIGLRTQAEAQALAAALSNAPHVKATGVYTHFAVADEPQEDGNPNAYSLSQLQRFEMLKAFFDPAIPAHAANSAMSLLAPNAYFSMVRQGISLYGYPPVKTSLSFRPALRWEAELVHIKEIAPGESVGYGCTYTAATKRRVATVAVGYGDGYHRALSNRGQMLLHGKRAPILGRVCMDQTMIDITEIPRAAVGDMAVLIGNEQGQTLSAEEVAAWAGTIPYEVLLSILPRVPRRYLHE